MQAGFDEDRDFMLVEVDGDALNFQTISRTGLTIDSGVLQKQSSLPTLRRARINRQPPQSSVSIPGR
jgi:hypothetical protein